MGDNIVTGLRIRVDVTGTKYDRHLDEECDSGAEAVRQVVEFFDRDEDYDSAALLRDLAAGGVTCDQDSDGGWVDCTADRILSALLAAGWTAPTGHTPASPERVVGGSTLERDVAEAIEKAEDEDGGPLDAARAALNVVERARGVNSSRWLTPRDSRLRLHNPHPREGAGHD